MRIGCRCRRRWVRRSPHSCSAAGRGTTGGRCSCGPGRPSRRSRPARSPRPCGGRAGERESRRWARTDCATRWLARWSQPASRWCRSRRCCGITACRAQPPTRGWISISCDCWPRRGQQVRSDERTEHAPGGLPAIAPSAGVQARTRRAAAGPAHRLPRDGGRGDGHQRTGDRVGTRARQRGAEPLGEAVGHRAQVRRLSPHDRPGGRGAAARGVPRSPAPSTPYLWPHSDIGRLLEGARTLRSPLRAATHETLFGLLAAVGMRVGEAIALQREDVDLGTGVVTIRAAKFNRSRLVPLHPTTTDALRRYAAVRDRLCPRPSSSAFFLSSAGTALDRSGVSKTFREITTAIGVRTATVHPRIHDLKTQLRCAHPDRMAAVRGQRRRAHRGVVHLPRPCQPGRHLLVSVRLPGAAGAAAQRLHARLGAGR